MNARTISLAEFPLQFSWEYEFQHPPEPVWGILSNNDRFNRAVGLPAVEFETEPDPDGGSKRFGSYRMMGFPTRWREHSYEWVRSEFIRTERTYISGPLVKLSYQLQFSPTATGCRMKVFVLCEANSRIFHPLVRFGFGVDFKKKCMKAYRRIDAFLGDQAETPYEFLKMDNVVTSERALSDCVAKLMSFGVAEDLALKLAAFVLHSQPQEVLQIRPFRLARAWERDRFEVLSAFLRGVKAGLFAVSWDLLCPSCRGPKKRASNLGEVTSTAHCESCNIDYEACLDESVELTFSVSSSLREVYGGIYCVGAPANTPHYLAQLRVFPGEVGMVETSLTLEPGVHIFRSLQSQHRYRLEVTPARETEAESETVLDIVFIPDSRETTTHSIPAGSVRFLIQSDHLREITVILERATWLEDVCTAATVTSLQEFRDMFSAEVLRPGQEISIQNMALVFTDLKGSTAMYRRVGDATAFSLVRDHFDILIASVQQNQGALVKTIGDAVMAAFTLPENALKAALDIQAGIVNHNRRQGVKEALVVKVGIHTGPCYAVNLNDRLDYFGGTVNIAARTEGQCRGNDVVITEAMFASSAVRRVIKKSGRATSRFKRQLKGFDDEFNLYRIKCGDS